MRGGIAAALAVGLSGIVAAQQSSTRVTSDGSDSLDHRLTGPGDPRLDL